MKREVWNYHGYTQLLSRGSISWPKNPLGVNRSYTLTPGLRCILIVIRVKESTADRRVHDEQADETEQFDAFFSGDSSEFCGYLFYVENSELCGDFLYIKSFEFCGDLFYVESLEFCGDFVQNLFYVENFKFCGDIFYVGSSEFCGDMFYVDSLEFCEDACAPRYIWFSVSQPKYDPDDNRWSKEVTVGNRREPVGTCWVVYNNFNESQEYSPCRTKYWGYHRQGSCQAGLGAAMSKNGERLFIGAPGSWYWQGQIYSISTAMKLKFVATMVTSEAEASGQAFSQPLNSRARIMFTKEGPATEDDSYMGYSVTTGDFIGNGDSGTAVGVPRGSDLLGKVILFTSNMTNPRNITGEQMGAYFGYAVASGDIDGDGSDDLIVGAPMYTVPDNPEMTIETGRVYVFYQGAGAEKFRKVDSRDGESNRGRFGLSLASLGDIDRDGYGDFVVGAPYGVTCLPLRACFKYTGEGVFSKHSFNIQYVLDVKKTKSPRLFFLELEGRNTMNRTIKVDRDQQFCRTVQVYVTPNIRDKLTSLDAEMRMSLEEERFDDNRPRDPRLALRPILGSTTSRKDSLSIRKNCGSDNVCIPDLQMNVTSNVHKYLLGSGKRLELDVYVQNIGEDAFEATYNLKLPAGIDYIKVEKIETMGVPVQCSAPKQSNNNTLRCDIGNPLQKNRLVKFKVLLQPVTSHGMKPIYEFEMDVNTTNPENLYTTGDNTYSLKLPIWIETDLRVDGESKPKDLYYNPDNYTSDTNATTEAEFGPAMTHNYTIRNQGPSEVIEAEAFLIWPAQTLAGNELLYLLEQPETNGPIACEPANANYLSLKLDQRRRVFSHHSDPSGVILDESHSGRTINVQRGFDIDRNKLTQKEEADINSGDSSNIQKSRHSSSSSNVVTSETRRIQLSGTGDKPDVLITTYTQNNSGTGSINAGDLTAGNRGMVFHAESGGSGDTGILGGGFRSSDGSSLGTRVTGLEEEDYRTRVNHSQTLDNRWGETGVSKGRTSDGDQNESEESRRTYQELLRQQEQMQRKWDEERLYYHRRQETSGGYRGADGELITGDREETVRGGDYGLQLRNVSSTQELERIFGSLSKSTDGYQLYDRQGKHYVQFMGRFRTSADGREYIEFQDGSMFPLQNRLGGQSYVSESSEPRDSRFLRIEGELLVDSTAKGFIVLKDGRRFPLQGSFSYTEERTYTLGPSRGQQAGRAGNDYETKSYSKSWNEDSSQAGDVERDYESRYSSTHEEKRMEDRKVTSRVYGRENREIEEDSKKESGRIKRESDMIDVKQFKKFEKLHRRPRDLENDPITGESDFAGETDYENDPRAQGPVGPCETAKCVMLRCVLGPLKKDQEVWIAARYRVDARTLKKVALQEKVRVSTKLVAQVTKQPFIGTPAEQVIKSHEIKTNVEPSSTPSAPDVIPLWVVVLSACAGTIILLLLIFLLHKVCLCKLCGATVA
ncbi:Integrin alpha-PS2 [Habropoda laboriosa]|uniref:Integrin alpha-PS2 n=1 Tax=Habropoda laboriosa TaxID=597456 RepID=A0A0L7R7E6_9HYME|nr:Integrin alpha-PS2 [Habropoda laboriosa]